MRICFLGPAHSVHFQRWVEYFAAHSYDVHVVSLNPIAQPIAGVQYRFLRDGESSEPHPSPARQRSIHLPAGLSLIKTGWTWVQHGLRQALQEIRPDVVHGHFVSEYGYYAALGGYQPLVVSAWGSDLLIHPKRSPVMRAAVGSALRKSALVHVLAPVLAAEVQRYSIAPDRILTVPIGVEAALLGRVPRAASRERVVIVSTRAFSDIYDLPTLLHAVDRLRKRHPQVLVRLAGDGPLRGELEQLTARLRLQQHVEFLGHYSRSQLADVLTNADVYVSTSLSDGASISLLEAMAVGLVPVVSDIPANRDWITPGVNGWLVPPRAIDQWAAALAEACGRLDQRPAIAAANKTIIRQRAVWEDQMRKVEEAYERLAKQP